MDSIEFSLSRLWFRVYLIFFFVVYRVESDESISFDWFQRFYFSTKGGQCIWTQVYFRPWLLCRHRTRPFLRGGCNSVFPLHEWSSLLGKAAFCPALDWVFFKWVNVRISISLQVSPTTGSLITGSKFPCSLSLTNPAISLKRAFLISMAGVKKLYYELEEIQIIHMIDWSLLRSVWDKLPAWCVLILHCATTYLCVYKSSHVVTCCLLAEQMRWPWPVKSCSIKNCNRAWWLFLFSQFGAHFTLVLFSFYVCYSLT